MSARSSRLLATIPLLAACSADPVPPADAGRTDVTVVDAPVIDVPVIDVPVVDVPVIDVPVIDRPVVDVARVDAPMPVDVGVDVPPADVPPLPPGRVSVEMGGTTAIALDRDGQPSIAYGSQQGAMVRVVVSTRAGTGWTHETVDTLPTAVSRMGYTIDPEGARHLGYAQYLSRSGVGYGFRFFAATRAAGAWTTRLLADHSVNHNTSVRPDIHVTAAGAVHVVVPLTPATGIASRVRHLALEGGAVVDEELAPRVSGSSFGVAIGRIAAAIHGDAPLTLFTVADDGSGSDTVAHLSTRSGSAMVATAIGSFPDLGSSLTEVWGADVFRLASGYVTVTADASGRFGDTTRYRVFRQGAAAWTMNTVGPVRYASDNWCAAPFADGTIALFVYAGVGMPVTATELRLILVRPDGTSAERSVDANVEGGLFCSAVTDASTVHVAYRKPDGGIYYQRLPR
ncbi:MAG: hypothetical protein Q8S73_37250 [Deltaproteobacteria bacterium]|nr:hypothetical protein [Myxococcales bacterium]MDP3219809.1 hypothetical protein [Deltaproteobacteria bacterium]